MLQIYKQIAEELGIKIHPATGEAKYKEKLIQECIIKGLNFNELVEKYSTHSETSEDTVVNKTTKQVDLPENIKNFSLESAPDPVDHNAYMKLIRVKVIPNDPSRAIGTSEIRTVGNLMHDYTKCIPYNVPTHIPVILYNVLKEARYQRVVKSVDPKTGQDTSRVEDVPAYTIEKLEPLTKKELEAIAQEQLARK